MTEMRSFRFEFLCFLRSLFNFIFIPVTKHLCYNSGWSIHINYSIYVPIELDEKKGKQTKETLQFCRLSELPLKCKIAVIAKDWYANFDIFLVKKKKTGVHYYLLVQVEKHKKNIWNAVGSRFKLVFKVMLRERLNWTFQKNYFKWAAYIEMLQKKKNNSHHLTSLHFKEE